MCVQCVCVVCVSVCCEVALKAVRVSVSTWAMPLFIVVFSASTFTACRLQDQLRRLKKVEEKAKKKAVKPRKEKPLVNNNQCKSSGRVQAGYGQGTGRSLSLIPAYYCVSSHLCNAEEYRNMR